VVETGLAVAEVPAVIGTQVDEDKYP